MNTHTVLQGGSRIDHFPVSEKKPLISIIIVTYNAEKHLRSCLDAVNRQPFQHIELLIFDGRSTDNTIRILQEYDRHISYWESTPDKGIYDAMNKALNHIKGQWVLFLGADDCLLEGFSLMAERLKDIRTIYYGDCIAGEEIRGGAFSAYRLAKMNLCQQGVFYPAAVFSKYRYMLSYPIFADYLLNMQCWGDATFSKQYYPLNITSFNPHGFSSSGADPLFREHKPRLVRQTMGWYVYIRYRIRKWKESRRKGSEFF